MHSSWADGPRAGPAAAMMRLVRVAGVLALLAACASSTDPRHDPWACEQTREFSNHGCADIHGVVLDAEERGVQGIYVGARDVTGRGGFNSPYATTDSEGRFRLRLTQYSRLPTGSGPDTVSVFVIATDPRSATVGVPATVRDSVLALLTVTPLGSVPEPTLVEIRLGIP